MSRLLHNWIDSYLEYTDRTEPPQLFKDWMAVSVISAALRRRCWFEWYTKLYPNMFIILVGPAACRKGTAMYPAKKLLETINIPMCSQAITREAMFKRLSAGEILCSDLHPEYTPNSMTTMSVFSDELTSFIGYDNREFIGNLCDLYDSHDTWTWETIKHGQVPFRGLCLSLVGATTPELLGLTLPKEAIGGGFTSRCILVYGDKKCRVVLDPRLTAKERELGSLLQVDLSRIAELKGPFHADDNWMERYSSLYEAQESFIPIEDSRFEHYIGRRQSHLIKLCMAISASRDDSMLFDGWVFDRAYSLLLKTEAVMPYVFSGFGRLSYASLQPQIIRFLAIEKELPVSAVYGRFQRDIEPAELNNLLQGLQALSIVQLIGKDGKNWVKYTPERFKDAEARKQGKAKMRQEDAKHRGAPS